MANEVRFELAVLGAGPAGLAAALRASRRGLRVLVLGKPRRSHAGFGESLSPGARSVLQELGAWSGFEAGGHLPCPGYLHSWGSSELSHHSFTTDPRGHAWHLDRPRFEAGLARDASEAGAVIATVRASPHLSPGQQQGSTWRIDYNRRDGTAYALAGTIIDASGPGARWAHQLGSRRILHAPQFATVARMTSSTGGISERCSLVESTPDGWWYSALLPDSALVLAYFSSQRLSNPARWDRCLRSTIHVRQRVESAGYCLDGRLRTVSACSEHLEPVAGVGWRAAGDAALTHDPIAAHGIMFALLSGRDAADSLIDEAAGQTDAAAQYTRLVTSARERYLKARDQIYSAEQRFADAPYWAARCSRARSRQPLRPVATQ
ncbi:MAG: FAD-binding protein [Myxococcales bacterium]|nr:FAD-binding protein [Myxococcales bacterium]